MARDGRAPLRTRRSGGGPRPEGVGRDSVYERRCGPPDGALGNGAARGDGSESEDENEDERLAADLAKARKMTERTEARMRQRKRDTTKRADIKVLGRMDEDGDFGQGAIGGRGDGADDALTGEGAGVAFDEEGDDESTGADEEAQAAKPPRRRRGASPEQAEGGLGPEPAWSDRHLYRLDEADIPRRPVRLGRQRRLRPSHLSDSPRAHTARRARTVTTPAAAATRAPTPRPRRPGASRRATPPHLSSHPARTAALSRPRLAPPWHPSGNTPRLPQ